MMRKPFQQEILKLVAYELLQFGVSAKIKETKIILRNIYFSLPIKNSISLVTDFSWGTLIQDFRYKNE